LYNFYAGTLIDSYKVLSTTPNSCNSTVKATVLKRYNKLGEKING
jgi:hypothetical protein